MKTYPNSRKYFNGVTVSAVIVSGSHGNSGFGYVVLEKLDGTTTMDKPFKRKPLPAWLKNAKTGEDLGYGYSAYGTATRYVRPGYAGAYKSMQDRKLEAEAARYTKF